EGNPRIFEYLVGDYRKSTIVLVTDDHVPRFHGATELFRNDSSHARLDISLKSSPSSTQANYPSNFERPYYLTPLRNSPFCSQDFFVKLLRTLATQYPVPF